MAKEVWTIKRVLEWTTSYLMRRGIENPRLNAEWLLGYVLKRSRLDLYLEFDRPLSSSSLTLFKKLILERSQHIPLSYLVGHQNFMALKFKVNSNVYIPCPETEILVKETLKTFQGPMFKVQGGDEALKPFIMVDLGTGCGNIAISLIKRIKGSKAYAIDISREALKVAVENARFYRIERRIEFLEGDMFSPLEGLNLKGKIDLVISNPPYIATEEMPKLSLEVKKEPRIALDGGRDGLSFYRRIIRETPPLLNKGGLLALEMGYDQADKVRELILAERDLEPPVVIPDYDGNQRVTLSRKR
ncbi:MAG: peptide chain release factor N(5)-glutamine methyltransferase [Candidatus Aerophobetes bacterium]|nr:peptide chain release factor N(5)-glutamine methyltransferase [Candidatus Aerophobetes bacterium]